MSAPPRRTKFSELLPAAVATQCVIWFWFGGWFIAFGVMGAFDIGLLVGMNYLVWPIVFPLIGGLCVFFLFLATLPLYRCPPFQAFRIPLFWMAELLPLAAGGLLVMLLSCPLDVGGTWWSEGAAAFSRTGP